MGHLFLFANHLSDRRYQQGPQKQGGICKFDDVILQHHGHGLPVPLLLLETPAASRWGHLVLAPLLDMHKARSLEIRELLRVIY